MKEYIITINNRSYNVVIKKLHTDTALVEVDGQEFEVGVERKLKRHTEPLAVKPVRPQTPRPAHAASEAAAQAITATGQEVVAPLPGLILTLLVREGARVKSGQTLLKMEAMKMENEIKANRDGVVEKIFVKEGDAVLENAPLVKIRD